MVIVNGRLEPGRFTCITQAGASLVDYFVKQTKNFSNTVNLSVSDLSEFSDHCPIEISLNIKHESPSLLKNLEILTNWFGILLINMLESKRVHFDEATEAICNDASEIDNKIILLTDMIYVFLFVAKQGRRVKGNQAKRRKPATWFNQDC